MKAKVTVEKVVVQLGERVLELTLEEARALKQVLNDTLEPKITWTPPVVIERHYDTWPDRWPQPIWAGTSEKLPHSRPFEITC